MEEGEGQKGLSPQISGGFGPEAEWSPCKEPPLLKNNTRGRKCPDDKCIYSSMNITHLNTHVPSTHVKKQHYQHLKCHFPPHLYPPPRKPLSGLQIPWIDLPVFELYVKESHRISSWIWLLSLHIVRFLHGSGCSCGRLSFFYSFHHVTIHTSAVDGRLRSFHFFGCYS